MGNCQQQTINKNIVNVELECEANIKMDELTKKYDKTIMPMMKKIAECDDAEIKYKMIKYLESIIITTENDKTKIWNSLISIKD